MASKESAVPPLVDAPITRSIEERMKDLGVKDEATTIAKRDHGDLPAADVKEEEKKGEDSNKAPKAEKKKETDKDEGSKSEKKEEEKTKEVKEVVVPSVDHKCYAGDEGKREDVPTAVVHEVPKEEVPSSSGSSQSIFYSVGSKVLSTVSSVKDAIIGKSGNGGK